MAAPTSASAASITTATGVMPTDDSQTAGRPRAASSTTKRLARQTSQLFRGGSVKNIHMDEIVARACEQVWADTNVELYQKETKAVGVMKELLTEAGTIGGYSDNAIRHLVKGQAAKMKSGAESSAEGEAKTDAKVGVKAGQKAGQKAGPANGCCTIL